MKAMERGCSELVVPGAEELQAVEPATAAVAPVSDSAGRRLRMARVLMAEAEDGSGKGAEQSVEKFAAMRNNELRMVAKDLGVKQYRHSVEKLRAACVRADVGQTRLTRYIREVAVAPVASVADHAPCSDGDLAANSEEESYIMRGRRRTRQYRTLRKRKALELEPKRKELSISQRG